MKIMKYFNKLIFLRNNSIFLENLLCIKQKLSDYFIEIRKYFFNEIFLKNE